MLGSTVAAAACGGFLPATEHLGLARLMSLNSRPVALALAPERHTDATGGWWCPRSEMGASRSRGMWWGGECRILLAIVMGLAVPLTWFSDQAKWNAGTPRSANRWPRLNVFVVIGRAGLLVCVARDAYT